ncbi:hypothetical protein ACJJTC_013948 [Scirpophaga incertulas]
MTPRSRKPLIVTSERRDSLPEASEAKAVPLYRSMSPNDSDFVSSDDDVASRSSHSCDRSHRSNASVPKQFDARSLSLGDVSPLRSQSTRFVISHERPMVFQWGSNRHPRRRTSTTSQGHTRNAQVKISYRTF